MTRGALLSDPTFLPASLEASSVGTWDYDVPTDRMRYCRATAALFGLPVALGAEGIPIERMAAAIHPEDRSRGLAKRMHLFQHGGAFVVEYRVRSAPGVLRWILVRGFYEADEAGRVVRGRGIMVDVTESKVGGFADGDVFFLTEAADGEVNALARATRHVLAARQALDALGPEAALRLHPAADALLLEIAQHIAGTLVPVRRDRTSH